MKCPKSGLFKLKLVNVCGKSGKAVLNGKLYYLWCKWFQFVDIMLFGQVRCAVFRALLNYFILGKDVSAPLEKFAHMPMHRQLLSWFDRICRDLFWLRWGTTNIDWRRRNRSDSLWKQRNGSM